MTIDERVKYALDTMGDMGRESQERVLRAHFLAVAEQQREACAKIAVKADKSTHPADIADAIRASANASSTPQAD
jgi:hypothetical protein